MKQVENKFLVIRNENKKALASFRSVDKLTVLNSEAIRLGLLGIVTNKSSELEINLGGIRFMDSSVIDVFNILSRMAKRFGSRVKLTHVGHELMELIELVKLYSVFDIRTVLPEEPSKIVA